MEDFQEYHNPVPVAQTLRLSRQRASVQVYDQAANHSFEDEEDHEHESSPSGSGPHSSEPDEAVFDISSRHSSPRTSHHSDDDISEFPHEIQDEPTLPDTHHSSSPYTPYKTRSAFRNPSSVRAMQMDTTPPLYLTPSLSQHRYNLASMSRNGTPRSTRSIRSHSSAMRSPSKISSTKKMKKEYPLILLHVTLLPIPVTYSTEAMENVLPAYILENWKLLQEKATDTILTRGILIPHPKEDYDLLEERLLESLELKLPRVLKCGHFHLDTDEAADTLDLAAEDDDSDDDADICDDCGRRIRDGRFGSGTGHRRWDIKLFAANGLMRAGAWGAAWREMERVDVEITPWMSEDMKRELELRPEQEERQLLEPFSTALPEEILHEVSKPATMDDARLREIYGDDVQQYVDGLAGPDDDPVPHPNISPSPPPRQTSPQHPRHDVPLSLLLRNYIYVASQDRRNIAIFLLSILVLLLSLTAVSKQPPSLPHPPPPPHVPTLDLTPAPSALSSPGVMSSSSSAIDSNIAPSEVPAQVEDRDLEVDEEVGGIVLEL